MRYIKKNKYKNLSLWSETKVRKVSHKETIYGQTRQILSKTEAEGGRLRFLTAVICCYIRKNKYKNLILWSETKIREVSHKEAIYGQTSQILSKTETEERRRLQFPIAVTLRYIKKNKYQNLRLWSETKVRKVSHNETIYGQTRQILSKTETEGRRRLRFLIAVTLRYIKKNKYKNLGLWSETKISKLSHKEAIYGLTRQIISNTKTEA